jgi:hypothetical protein
VDGDVPEGGAGADLDRVLARSGTLGGFQVVAHGAVAGVEVQPGGGAVADPDLDLAEGGLGEDGAVRDLARRTSPLADLAATVALAWSTEIRALAAFTRRSPVTRPIQMSPLEFLTTAVPSMPSIRTEPEPVVSSASPPARSTVMSPTPVRSCTAPAWSSWMSPMPVL